MNTIECSCWEWCNLAKTCDRLSEEGQNWQTEHKGKKKQVIKMDEDEVSVDTSIGAYLRRLLGRSVDSDCNVWNYGRCGISDECEEVWHHQCTGVKNCRHYRR